MSSLVGWLADRFGGNRRAGALRQEWADLPEPPPGAGLDKVRLVAVDTETSGLDPRHDRLIAIGACSIQAGAMHIGDSLEVLLRQEHPSSPANILLHGIGRHAQSAGEPFERALARYLRFARRDPLVGFNVRFDLAVLQRAVRAAFGISYRPPALDLALLLPALSGHGSEWDLDHWLAHYRLRPFTRHDALADAAVSAELFLVAIEQARARRLCTLRDLARLQRQQLELMRLTAR